MRMGRRRSTREFADRSVALIIMYAGSPNWAARLILADGADHPNDTTHKLPGGLGLQYNKPDKNPDRYRSQPVSPQRLD